MWTITGFADEISDDVQEQCKVLAGLRIRHLELRAAWKTNVADLSDRQLAEVAAILADHDITVSSIGSPIGKISVTDDFAAHLDRFDRCLHVAETFGAPFVRIFSFFPAPGTTPEQARPEVLRRMAALVERARGRGVVLLHENEKDIYGDIPARCADVLSSTDSPLLQAAWDSANFVQCGVRPYDEGYTLLRPWIAYVHVKDAHARDGSVTPVGQGDGDFHRVLTSLKADGFDGFLSLEPHLSEAGAAGGFSGPDLFTVAHTALTGLLQELGIDYA
jgi:sugar phosphate isomerase/epimerase